MYQLIQIRFRRVYYDAERYKLEPTAVYFVPFVHFKVRFQFGIIQIVRVAFTIALSIQKLLP